MGIGPVYAVPKLPARQALKIEDIDLWELNAAIAVQVVYCRDRLGIPMERLNVDGGAISIGHPYGMSSARLTSHALIGGVGGAPGGSSSPCASAVAWALRDCSNWISPPIPITNRSDAPLKAATSFQGKIDAGPGRR